MYQLLELANPLLADQHQSHGLDAASRRAGATAHNSEHQQHQWQEIGPLGEVRGGEAGGGGNGNGLEQAVQNTAVQA